jgi:hypothetical protein
MIIREPEAMDIGDPTPPRHRHHARRLFAAVGQAGLLMAAAGLSGPVFAQSADDVTYTINDTIGKGSVTGQIVTDGNSGVLTKADIISWNLILNAPGQTFTLTTANSGFLLVGSDVIVNGQKLTFNYSGTDGGYIAFQASSPGFYSGYHYWCNDTNWYGCAKGASVVPNANTDASAQYVAMSGAGVLGTAVVAVPLNFVAQSITTLANARTGQMLINQLMSGLLLGLNEQVSCGNCGGTDMTIGSLALSGHGRIKLSPNLTVLLGANVGTFQHRESDVRLTAGGATALRFDPVGLGHLRPFAEIGTSADYQDLTYTRAYESTSGIDSAQSRTNGYDLSAYGRVGLVARVNPRTELAVSGTISRQWQHVAGYAETADATNPFNATVPGGTDKMTTASLNAQATHLFGLRWETDINGGATRAFSATSGLNAQIAGIAFQPSRPAFTYFMVGGRIGYRLRKWATVDVYVNSIFAPQSIGSSTHGGFGLRIVW